jgi:spermidine/putrescine transport system substrate-binding protein
LPKHITFDSWDDLWDPALKNKVFLVDGAREIMGMGLNSLGYSLNSRKEHELRDALFENVRSTS